MSFFKRKQKKNIIQELAELEKEAILSKEEEVQFTDPKKIIFSGLLVIFLFFGLLGGWMAIARISGAVIAPGQFKVENERKVVQHLEGGIVKEIMVKDGDTVEKGQVLLVLEDKRIKAGTEMLQDQLDGLLAHKARLEAQRDLKKRIVWPESCEKKRALPRSSLFWNWKTGFFTRHLRPCKGAWSFFKNRYFRFRNR